MMLICNSFELVSHKCHNVYFVPSAQVFCAHRSAQWTKRQCAKCVSTSVVCNIQFCLVHREECTIFLVQIVECAIFLVHIVHIVHIVHTVKCTMGAGTSVCERARHVAGRDRGCSHH